MKTVAERFVHAYTQHNRADLLDVLAPDVDFRGMTPGRFWEAPQPRTWSTTCFSTGSTCTTSCSR